MLRNPPDAPIERIDPLDPIDRMDPAEPIDRIEPTLPNDSSEPADSTDQDDMIDPTERFDSTDARLRYERTDSVDPMVPAVAIRRDRIEPRGTRTAGIDPTGRDRPCARAAATNRSYGM